MSDEQIINIIEMEAHKSLIIVNIGTDENPDYVIRGIDELSKSILYLVETMK